MIFNKFKPLTVKLCMCWYWQFCDITSTFPPQQSFITCTIHNFAALITVINLEECSKVCKRTVKPFLLEVSTACNCEQYTQSSKWTGYISCYNSTFRLLQWCRLRLKPFEKWRSVIVGIVPDVSKFRIAFIFRVQQSTWIKLLGLPDPTEFYFLA
jgi:hypothetical protein